MGTVPVSFGRALRWAAVILYVAFTYATLGAMPEAWKRLNALCRGNGLAVQYALYALLWACLLAYLIVVKRERARRAYIRYVLYMVLFMGAAVLETRPSEKIHMAQYGVLGALVFIALATHFNRFDPRLTAWGALICVVAGAGDEVVQYFLPNRFFTWHDVIVNGVSGILMLFVIRDLVLVRPETTDGATMTEGGRRC